jgi:hypothetical protein
MMGANLNRWFAFSMYDKIGKLSFGASEFLQVTMVFYSLFLALQPS